MANQNDVNQVLSLLEQSLQQNGNDYDNALKGLISLLGPAGFVVDSTVTASVGLESETEY